METLECFIQAFPFFVSFCNRYWNLYIKIYKLKDDLLIYQNISRGFNVTIYCIRNGKMFAMGVVATKQLRLNISIINVQIKPN